MATELIIQGFKAAAVKSGIRGKDRLDLALIFSEVPAVAAGVFTTSLVKAAPVLLDMERLADQKARAILVNSGIANACTGQPGMADALKTAAMVARELDLREEEVLVASTGVIGQPLEIDCFIKGIPEVVKNLSAGGLCDVSRAIMTTDTVPKTAVREVDLGGEKVRIAGLAKGAGMIRPDMATMLCFVMTDAVVSGDVLRASLKTAVDRSFNRITVDGDTSTNDSVIIMANGLAGNKAITDGITGELFQSALDDLLTDLALQVVRDGEGATKLVQVEVRGAGSDQQARLAAHTVADSKLVKTAFFGEDANWGRIMGALGRSGAAFDPEKVDVFFDGVQMVRNGLGQGKDVEAAATEVLKKKEFTVSIDLKAGSGTAVYYTCDLSIDYVKINADYRS